MTLQFSSRAWEDYLFWQEQDKKILRKINTLIRDIARDPHGGLGKPEPLKHALSGFWSRRITDEHRLVYRVVDDTIQIVQARYHYE
jgi:toxin YoeB